MDYAVETTQLSKEFAPRRGWRRFARGRPVPAVSDVNLQVARGETFGLLGPNGAGKTTLVKMLCTLIAPSAGTATVAGHPLSHAVAIRAAVGLVVTDERSFYWRLSGKQNLAFFATMYGLRGAEATARLDDVLAAVEMGSAAERRFSDYSTGMKQRLAIARSLLHKPQILFLDEPTRSLDPAARARFHELVQRLGQDRQVTIFLITHDLQEAEKLCQRVAVMDAGRVQAVGSPADLRRRLAPRMRYQVLVTNWHAQAAEALRRWLPDLTVTTDGERRLLHFAVDEGNPALEAALAWLRGQEIAVASIEGQPLSLEEVFAHYTAEPS